MLRCRGEEYDLKLKLHNEMHFNMIRNWIGSVTDDEFYEACDKYGIMVWDDFWLNSNSNLPDDVFAFNMNAVEKIKRLRNHACIAVWCGDNEGRKVFWRILLFYVLAILVISLIIPYTDPNLLRNDETDISVSPFTLVFERAGLLSAAAVMNAVILTAVLSAGNSGMYASTRMLYTLAKSGKAPKLFAKLSKGGVPRNALIATTVIAALCFLTSM